MSVRRGARLIGLVAACAGAVAPAPAAGQPPPPPFEWTPVSRFAGDADGDGRLDSGIGALPRRLDDHPVALRTSAALCRARGRLRWRVDGRPRAVALAPAGRGDPTCRATVVLRGEGDHRIGVDSGRGFVDVLVRVDDRLVVALGDSVASGEGNPAPGGAWLERRCHRAAAAGFEQAARLLAAQMASSRLQRRSMTFVSLACSGATIPAGLTGPYRGIEPDAAAGPFSPQVERLRRLDAVAPVDAVLVSVGANDVHFSDVVRHCVARPRCFSARFDPDRTGARRTADAEVGVALERLVARYDALAAGLRPIAPPERVLLTEYFDPTHDAAGGFCARTLPGLSREEVRWASDAMLGPLNHEVAAAAARHGWVPVGGIARDFQPHGYCTPVGDRWVLRLSESLQRLRGSPLPGARAAGTLHPNEAGHLAIADRVAPRLAEALRVDPPEGRTDTAEAAGIAWWVVLAIVAGALAYLGLLALAARRTSGRLRVAALVLSPLAVAAMLGVLAFALGRRLWCLLRPAGRPDPAGDRVAPAALPPVEIPKSWRELATRVGAALVGVVVSTGFVAFVGAAILWVRFSSLRIPAADAVSVVPNEQLISVGAEALVIFALLGALAFVVAWLLDGQGKPVRASRRGLGALIVIELVLAVAIGDFRLRQAAELVAWFAVAAVLLHFLVDRALWLAPQVRERSGREVATTALRALVGGARGALAAWRLAPVALLAGTLYWAGEASGADRWLVLVPIALAAALFVAPGGLAGGARDAGAASLEPPRVALAATALACLAVFLARDELWLLGAALVAAALAGACVIVGRLSGNRFLPYGVAVLVSVPVFGAAVTVMWAYASPEAQPVAAVSKNLKHAACGVYVADTGERIYLARVELDELGARRVPRPRRSRMTSLARADLAVSAVGPLQPATRAQDQALTLRRELLRTAGADAETIDAAHSCAPADPPVRGVDSPQRRLAERFQPELVLDRREGFWPVPVRTIFAMQDRRARVCRRIDDRDEKLCVRLGKQGDLPWAGGDGEWIEYPQGSDQRDQRDATVEALGSVDPARTAVEYFLVTGGDVPSAPVSVQYWFFYTFNDQPVALLRSAGRHEGDFESAGVLLSARTRRPRYVWMARHDDEGRVFTWNDPALRRSGRHVRVFVARGSHASYESCLRQARPKAPRGLIDDHPTCRAARQMPLAPESTPLTDLSRVPWACWRGLFGHRPGERALDRIPYLEANAPRSPLWQQRFAGVRSEPCRGVEEPGQRDGPGEEVLPDATAAALRRGAGRLDPLVDDCRDWEQPPPTGVYLVACDARALRRFVDSGLEDPGPVRVRVDDVEADRLATGPLDVPAVRRDAVARRMDGWRIAVTGPTTLAVYASCREGRALLAARFPAVLVSAGQPLRLDDRARSVWRLRREDGSVAAAARPERVRPRPAPDVSGYCRGS